MSCIKIAQILTSFCFARYVNSAPPMNVKSIDLVSSTGLVFGVAVAGFRICLASTMYFSLLLSASLLMPWYVGRTPGMAGRISIDFLTFLTFEALREQSH